MRSSFSDRAWVAGGYALGVAAMFVTIVLPIILAVRAHA